MPPAISVGTALEARVGATQVSAVGRGPSDKSAVAVPSQKASSSRFSFRYPLRSLWPGGGGGVVTDKRHNGLALDDDAVLLESGEATKATTEEDTGSGKEMPPSDAQNRNWVLKILHIKSLQSRDEQGTMITEKEEETKEEDKRNEAAEAPLQRDVGDDACDMCRVDDNEEDKEIEFDRHSFSKMLRKVSLAEAKVYAQMSYLGNLAYSVAKIKVNISWHCFLFTACFIRLARDVLDELSRS